MSDLISRQSAIDALEERLRVNGYSNVALVSELNKSIGYLMRLPSAQPEQQKAIWALRTYMPHHYYCTHCKKDSPYNKTWSYCPNCGCEMEGYV